MSSVLLPDAEALKGLPSYARAAVQQLLDETVARWVFLRTHPPTAMNRDTGELIDLPEERCPVCRRWHG